MIIGIYENLDKMESERVRTAFVDLLCSAGHTTKVFGVGEPISKVDILIVLGGDGTILHIVEQLENKEIPIVGINYGHLGFLTEFERGEERKVLAFLDDFSQGKTTSLLRTMLEVKVNGATYFALNEVSLQRNFTDVHSKIMHTTVKLDEEEMLSFLGDGAILCTPTGSTAYSLSAGGAILDPKAPVFMLTPICSFSLHARPMVVRDDGVLEVECGQSSAVLLIDGKMITDIREGEKVVIRKSPIMIDFPLGKQSSFYQKVCKKLK